MTPGSILAAKSKSDEHLKHAKKEAKRIIHAFHKARDSNVFLEVSACPTFIAQVKPHVYNSTVDCSLMASVLEGCQSSRS